MRLSEYIRIIRRRIWVIVLAVMVTAVAAYVFSKLQEPLYRSEASYLV
ncbi:MAG: Wzz/FepE/Etk N-terminal domain-containing protein, partial [Bacteroidota bacterium]